MANILWLDDQQWEITHFCDELRVAGHVIELADSEDDVLRRLQIKPQPDIFIQDLGRSVSYLLAEGDKLTTYEGFLEDAGWRFYERFLEKKFPLLPVIICTNLASNSNTKNRSDKFNLKLLQKNDSSAKILLSTIAEISSTSKTILKTSVDSPLIVSLDFDRVNTALLRHLKNNPKDIHKLSWANFEVLAERLLIELGYEVKRTQLTRDGGVDIWAIKRSDLGDILYAIDAKKYSPNQLVGPDLVRAIYGVTNMNNASVGMIITTSSFTMGARSLESQLRYRISLKEYDDLVQWLKLVAS